MTDQAPLFLPTRRDFLRASAAAAALGLPSALARTASAAGDEHLRAASGAALRDSRFPMPGTVGVLGPSTAFNCGGVFDPRNVPTGGAGNTGRSIWAYVNYYLAGRGRMLYNSGISGDTSAGMLARLKADVLSKRPKPDYWLVIEPTGNDVAVCTAATSIANIYSIYDRIRARGDTLLLCTPSSRSEGAAGRLRKFGGGTFTPSEYAAYVAQIRRAIVDYAASHSGSVLIDMGPVVTDPSTGTWYAGYSDDGIHPKAQGCAVIGKLVADAISSDALWDGLPTSRSDPTVPFGTGHFFEGTPSNEVQVVDIGGGTGGSYRLSVPANRLGIPTGTTGPIPWDANAAAIKIALSAVWGAGSFATTGNDPPWNHFVTWQGAYAGMSIPMMTINYSALAGYSGTPTVTRNHAGGVAAGWAVSATTGEVRLSIEARSDGLGNWQVIELLSNGATATLARQVGSGVALAGVPIYAEAEIELDGALIAPTTFELAFQEQSPVNVIASWGQSTGISPSPGAPTLGAGRGVARTPLFSLPQTATGAVVAMTIAANSGTTIRAGRMGWRKYEAPSGGSTPAES